MGYSDQAEFAALGGAPFTGGDVFASAQELIEKTAPSNSWRTPGINASASDGYILYPGLFGNKGQTVTQEAYEAAKKKNPLGVWLGERTGVLRPESEKRQGGIADLFVRGAFILIGTIFITIALVMLSRPAQEGLAEGIAEAIKDAKDGNL